MPESRRYHRRDEVAHRERVLALHEERVAAHKAALADAKRVRDRIKAEHRKDVQSRHDAQRAQYEADLEHHRAEVERIEREREHIREEHETLLADRAAVEEANLLHHEEWVAHLTQAHEDHRALVAAENKARRGWHRDAAAAVKKMLKLREETEDVSSPAPKQPDDPVLLDEADGPALPEPPKPLPEIPDPVLPEIPEPPVEPVLDEIPEPKLPPLPELPGDPGEEPPVYVARPVECGEEPWEMVETRWGTVRALDGSFVLEGPDGIHIVGEAELDRDYVRC